MSRTYRYRLCSCSRCEGHSSRDERRRASRRVRHRLAAGLDLPDGNTFRRLAYCEHGESRWPFGGSAAQSAVFHSARSAFADEFRVQEWIGDWEAGGGGRECDTRHFRTRFRFGGKFRRDRGWLASGSPTSLGPEYPPFAE